MGKIYGKQNGENKLIIDGDDIDQRLSALEANWDSIYLSEKIIIESNSNASSGLVAYKCGNEVKLYVIGLYLRATLNAWSSRTVATLETELRPLTTFFSSITTDNGVSAMGIKTNGNITIESRANTLQPNLNIYGSTSWFIE